MTSGIYSIINNINSKEYIGSSIEIEKRWSRHKYNLKNNTHGNDYLQRAWNKYGEKSFSFHIIKKCKPENLLEEEQSVINRKNNIYNIITTVGGKEQKELPESIKEKMAERKQIYWDNLENNCLECGILCGKNNYCQEHAKKCKNCNNRISRKKQLCHTCLEINKKIKCESCGLEVYKTGRNQKYCEECALRAKYDKVNKINKERRNN